MASHLADQAQKRHDDYMKAELASLREQLRLTQERLDSVSARLAVAERLAGVPSA